MLYKKWQKLQMMLTQQRSYGFLTGQTQMVNSLAATQESWLVRGSPVGACGIWWKQYTGTI